jgi:hypothetical protein
MIELNRDRLIARVPEVHKDATCSIDFQRTLRIPDDNREYPLPAGLGRFPVFHVDDFADRVPPAWVEHGGVFVPMYQSEALWINFSDNDYPFAIKVAAGKINAVSGELWEDGLTDAPQDYVVIPEQPWLDGFSIGKGLIRQFVAMPLGQGYSAEGQLTGKEQHGGLQLAIYPMRADVYAKLQQRMNLDMDALFCSRAMEDSVESAEMGLAPGGLMTQEIYEDDYGIDAWDTSAMSRCFVHIVDSLSFQRITGCRPPVEPPTAEQYEKARIPWFDYWNDEARALEGSRTLAQLDSVAAKKIKQGKPVKEPVVEIRRGETVQLGGRRSIVRDGKF